MKVQGKYIIIEILGLEVAVLFHSLINHKDIGTRGHSIGTVVSAGFFCVQRYRQVQDNGDQVFCTVFGESESLDMKPRPEDAELIGAVLNAHWR